MPQTGRKGSCYLLAVHLLGLNTVLFYAYDGHFYLALSTFSLLAIDDSIFLNLRWIPHFIPFLVIFWLTSKQAHLFWG
jgi:hypothetical protein